MTNAALREIVALRERATPGPWNPGGAGGWPEAVYHDCIYIAGVQTGEYAEWVGPNPLGKERAYANAAFIAAAGSFDFEQLSRQVEALEAEIVGLRHIRDSGLVTDAALRTEIAGLRVIRDAAQAWADSNGTGKSVSRRAALRRALETE